MNNFKSIIIKGRIQMSIVYWCNIASVFIILHYCIYIYIYIYIYIFYNKRVFKCKITSSPYLSTLKKYEVLRLKESKDER